MLGIWVRDDSQGIGTVTFITKDNKYCALGHGISDIDTGELRPLIMEQYLGQIYGELEKESLENQEVYVAQQNTIIKTLLAILQKTVYAACMEIWIRKLYQDITYLKKKQGYNRNKKRRGIYTVYSRWKSKYL